MATVNYVLLSVPLNLIQWKVFADSREVSQKGKVVTTLAGTRLG